VGKNIIIDFETIGIAANGNSDQAVVSLAAITFDSDITLDKLKKVPYLKVVDSTFYVKFALNTQKKGERFERTFDPDTLAWWKDQPPEVKKEIIPSSEDEQLNVGVQKFKKYLSDNGCDPRTSKIYCLGQHFDIPVMQSICDMTGVDFNQSIAKYWNIRDIRTVLDEAIGMSNNQFKLPKDIEDSFTKHDPKHDVAYCLYQMVYARALALGEITVEEMYKGEK